MPLNTTLRKTALAGAALALAMTFGLPASPARAAASEAGAANGGASWGRGWGSSASGAYLAGRFAEQILEFSHAADFYARVLDRDPGNIELRRRVLLLLTSEGRFDESLEEARVLAGADDQGSFAQLRLLVEEFRKGGYQAAEDALQKMQALRYNGFIKPTGLAWARVGRGDLAGAREALASLGENPGFATLRQLHEALVADVGGDQEKAAATYRSLFEEQERLPLRIAQHATNFFLRQGDIESARQIYDAFRRQGGQGSLIEWPDAGAAPEPLVADAVDGFSEVLFNLAGALYEERDTRSALLYGRLASVLRPDSSMVHLLLGEILETQGRHEAAIASYGSVDPGAALSRAARIRIARSLDDQERTEEAIEAFRALAVEYPDDPEPLVQLGHVLRGHERFAEAVEVYDEAMSRIDSVGKDEVGLLYARGIALERSNRWERAEDDLLKAIEVGGDLPYVLNYLGYSWVDRGMHVDRAEEMIRKAVELRPQDGFIADSLGWVYYQTGRFPEAVEELERAVALEPQDPVINEHLGDAYWKVGRKAEARFQWARALRMEPEAKRIVELRSKVQCGLGGCAAGRQTSDGSL